MEIKKIENRTKKKIEENKSNRVVRSKNQYKQIFKEDFKNDNARWVYPFWPVNTRFPSEFKRGDGYFSVSGDVNAWALMRGENGAFIDLLEGIEEDSVYEIACKVKSSSASTTMQFRLWVHDTNEGHNVTNPRNPKAFSSFSDQDYTSISVQFKATHTKAMRIHLLCKGGTGAIIFKEVTVKKI